MLKEISQAELDYLLSLNHDYTLEMNATFAAFERDNVHSTPPGAIKGRLVLQGYDLRGLDFRRADLTYADLGASDARGANFMGCKLPMKEEWEPTMTLADVCGVEFHGGWEQAESMFRRAV